MRFKVLAVLALLFVFVGVAAAQTPQFTFFIKGGGLHPAGVKQVPIEDSFASGLTTELQGKAYVASVTKGVPTKEDVAKPLILLSTFVEPVNSHTFVTITVILVNTPGSNFFGYGGSATSIVDTNLTGGTGADADPEVPVSLQAAIQHARIFFEHVAGLKTGTYN